MTWARRLISLARGDARSEKLRDQVAYLYSELSAAALASAAAAEAAPDPTAEESLRGLAESQSDLARRFHEVLQGGDIPVPGPRASASPPVGTSHWARLVAGLEHLRALRDHVLELSAQADERPDLAAALETLGRQLESQVTTLRRLIARADPQADD